VKFDTILIFSSGSKQYKMIVQKCLKPFTFCQSALLRSMSMWTPGFEDPILHKNELKNAKVSGEYKRKTLVPIKAADPTATCSNFLDKEFIDFLRCFLKEGKRHIGVREMNETFEIMKDIQLKKYYKASEERKESILTDPQEILKKAVHNARPLMAIQNVRVGGIVYKVPAPITMKRSLFESRRWILNAARDRDTRNIRIHETLANVLIETANNTGRVITQRNEHHKTCEQNRAYAHYRKSA